jgi:hypothetical protein
VNLDLPPGTFRYAKADKSAWAVYGPGGPSSSYRYELGRKWDYGNLVKWIMLNPSTASHEVDDPTIRKCMKFARSWGYAGIQVVNLFAYRSTDPKALKDLGYCEAVNHALGVNKAFLGRALAAPGPTICAWGQGGKLWSRARIFLEEIKPSNIPVMALKLSKDGTPYHPLYLRDNSVPFELR